MKSTGLAFLFRLMLFAVVVAAMVSATGCTTYPMGLTKEQWNALPPEQQAEYQARQAEIDEERRRAAAERQERIRQEREAAARAEQERIEARYQRAVYGDIIQVSIQGGRFNLYGKDYPYQPVSFDMVRGEARNITITHQGRVSQSVEFPVRFAEDGNTFFFYADQSSQTPMINHSWDRGQRYRLTTRDNNFNLVNASVIIRYKDLPGAPQRIILEQR